MMNRGVATRRTPRDAGFSTRGSGPFQGIRIGFRALMRLLRVVLLIVRWGTRPFLGTFLPLPPDPMPIGARLREVLQALGMTFSKFGQYLATRFDLLPEAVYREMQLFFESSPPFPFAQVREQIASEFGGPLEQYFRGFDRQSVAAASIGQVHHAVTLDGDEVAVKVLRPGIQSVLLADLQVLRWFAWISDALGVWGKMSASDTVEAFAATTAKELDFIEEASASETIRRSTRFGVTVPRVRRDLTTSRILTTEWVNGVSLLKLIEKVEAQDWDGLRHLVPAIDYSTIVTRYVDECLWELFGSGIFHGDPHPGNVLIAKDGMIYLVDFGIVGTLSSDERGAFTGFFESLAFGEAEICYYYYRILSPPSAYTDITRYRRTLIKIIDDWHSITILKHVPASERHSGRFMGRVANLMRENGVRWEPNHQLFWRCILALHSVQLRMSPDLDLFDAFRRTFNRVRPEAYARSMARLREMFTSQDLGHSVEAASRVATSLGARMGTDFNLRVSLENPHGSKQSWGAPLALLPVCVLAAIGPYSVLVTLSLAAVLVAIAFRAFQKDSMS